MCERILNEIQIAGAGAGKTYSLAAKILQRQMQYNGHKFIYAITYTNFAKENIKKRIIELKGVIPDNVKVETVHSFFLTEIIYPFSKMYFENYFNSASSCPLPEKIPFKKYLMAKLNRQNVIHNEQVFNKAKQIIVKAKSDTLIIKSKKDYTLDLLYASINSIFIDEAQDLDNDALLIFRELGKEIFIYMVGDPKQAIKAPNVFKTYSQEVCKDYNFMMLPINNSTRRIPESHLIISNLLCPEDEQQETINENAGVIKYIYSNDKSFPSVYDKYSKLDALIFCEKKTKEFGRDESNNKFEFEKSVRKKIVQKINKQLDPDAAVEALSEALILNTRKTDTSRALNSFLKKIDVVLEKAEYANLISDIQSLQENKFVYKTISIDKAKGLENNYCMFIMNNAMLEYLFDLNKPWNKEKMYLYIALTRSKMELILVIDINSIGTKLNTNLIDKNFSKIGIEKWHVL